MGHRAASWARQPRPPGMPTYGRLQNDLIRAFPLTSAEGLPADRRLCVHLRRSRRAVDADAPLHSVIAESRAAVSDAPGMGPRRYGREVGHREPPVVSRNGIALRHRSLL